MYVSRNWGFTPFPKDVFQEGRTGTIEWRGDPPGARRCLLVASSLLLRPKRSPVPQFVPFERASERRRLQARRAPSWRTAWGPSSSLERWDTLVSGQTLLTTVAHDASGRALLTLCLSARIQVANGLRASFVWPNPVCERAGYVRGRLTLPKRGPRRDWPCRGRDSFLRGRQGVKLSKHGLFHTSSGDRKDRPNESMRLNWGLGAPLETLSPA